MTLVAKQIQTSLNVLPHPFFLTNIINNQRNFLPFVKYCHNPNDNTTQQNLNTVVGLDTKMTVQTPPHPTTHTQH